MSQGSSSYDGKREDVEGPERRLEIVTSPRFWEMRDALLRLVVLAGVAAAATVGAAIVAVHPAGSFSGAGEGKEDSCKPEDIIDTIIDGVEDEIKELDN